MYNNGTKKSINKMNFSFFVITENHTNNYINYIIEKLIFYKISTFKALYKLKIYTFSINKYKYMRYIMICSMYYFFSTKLYLF